VIYELEYYSVGGGFIEWKGYEPPKKGQPKYPYSTMKELRQDAEKNNLSIADVIMANELSVSGKNEEEINAFLDKIVGAMLATIRSGLARGSFYLMDKVIRCKYWRLGVRRFWP
jgi:L-serine dehydratase